MSDFTKSDKPWKKEENKDELSIVAWIMDNNIVSEKGEKLDFSERLFLLDILTDWSKEIVIKKAAQIGGSVTFTLKTLYAVLKMRLNVIYTFPTDTDVNEFVTTKTNRILQMNPQVFSGLPTDNVERKAIGDRTIYYKGTVSKTAGIMTTSDLNVHDEASRSDQSVLETMKSRYIASNYKGRWLFSNPTTEKDAIDQAWKKSDMKEWMVTCTKCKFEQILTFPDSIDRAKKIFVCKQCKGEISNAMRKAGRWVPQKPGKEISGYHISLLMAPWVSAEEILKESEGDQAYFHNFILGEPYSPSDIRITSSTILDNWTPNDLVTGNYYLGVDVGNIKHYCLGSEKGVIKIGRFTKWSELDDLMKKYRPHLVIDALPENVMSKYYVETYRNALMSFFQENKSNPKTIVWWGEGDKKGIVYSNRNRILDQLIDEILRAGILFGFSKDSEVKLYLKHWETLRRNKVTDNRGIESYEWDSTTGEDHFVFATLYYYLARLGTAIGNYIPEQLEGVVTKQFIGNDNQMEDLGEALARVNGWEYKE